MRKVDKNKIFPHPPDSLNSDRTNNLRNDIIREKKYPKDEKKYDDRYRTEDIKEALKAIYHDKCAYCEKNIKDTNFHIDHHRPKAIYYWLAYSWDNLLLCCDKCNLKKGDTFDIQGKKRAGFNPNDLKDIHNLTPEYNKIEKPLLVNPELEDVEDKLIFDWKTGDIDSHDPRCRYTIECCELDRKEANEKRQKIWDDFYKRVCSGLFKISVLKRKFEKKEIDADDYKVKYHEYMGELKARIRDFRDDAFDPCKEYLAFRCYIVKNNEWFKAK